MKQNIILDKTFDFAVRVVRLCEWLRAEKREFVLSKQFLRSGTSIGANAEEGIGAISRPDFINKMQISYKEARETKYWIRLLIATEYLSANDGQPFLDQSEEILRILGAILNSTKNPQ